MASGTLRGRRLDGGHRRQRVHPGPFTASSTSCAAASPRGAPALQPRRPRGHLRRLGAAGGNDSYFLMISTSKSPCWTSCSGGRARRGWPPAGASDAAGASIRRSRGCHGSCGAVGAAQAGRRGRAGDRRRPWAAVAVERISVSRAENGEALTWRGAVAAVLLRLATAVRGRGRSLLMCNACLAH